MTIGTQRLAGLPPATWLRALTAISVLFVVVVAALLISMKDRASGSRGSGQTSDTITVQVPPSSNGSLKGPAGNLSPMPKPITAPTGIGPEYGATDAALSESAPDESKRSRGFSSKELALQSYIARHSGLATNTSVASVSLEKSGKSAAIWLTHLPRETGTDATRAEIVQAAIQGARAAFSGDPAIQIASIRVYIASESGSIEPTFDGEVSRADLQTLASNSTAEQAAGVFSNVRWSPSMSPSGGPNDQRRSDQEQ